MSPVKRAKRPVKRSAQVNRPPKRATPRARRKAEPVQPKPWTSNIRDLGLVSVNVSDWDRAKTFYAETLGFPVAFGDDQIGWVEYGYSNQAHLAISRWSRPGPMPLTSNSGIPVFTCPDVRSTVEQFRAKGIRCDDAVEIPNAVIFANFYDPDGNQLQLAQSVMPNA